MLNWFAVNDPRIEIGYHTFDDCHIKINGKTGRPHHIRPI